ncbi:hypothetical protein Q31b_15360 [Novipirellula aureliae]|uniref:Uncharacterized protein n=1 Tax=Novipirellula aureliae TaxID=2527966 RepID=A0A5C6E8I8_9BACT|nr:hypothetical protein [Novipirellula aureliae]TWU44001.1 hypothetical protein Q31b_15360 [Novipirellula aureliae]
MSSADPNAILEVAERNELEAILMEFDATWEPKSLPSLWQRLASYPNPTFRHLALRELIKVDFQRSWSAGNGRLLNEYLTSFPELGNNESVAPDLILAEYEARKSVDPTLDLASYESRFPVQFAAVKDRVGKLLDSAVDDSSNPKRTEQEVGQASIDTSRVDQLRDTPSISFYFTLSSCCQSRLSSSQYLGGGCAEQRKISR